MSVPLSEISNFCDHEHSPAKRKGDAPTDDHAHSNPPTPTLTKGEGEENAEDEVEDGSSSEEDMDDRISQLANRISQLALDSPPLIPEYTSPSPSSDNDDDAPTYGAMEATPFRPSRRKVILSDSDSDSDSDSSHSYEYEYEYVQPTTTPDQQQTSPDQQQPASSSSSTPIHSSSSTPTPIHTHSETQTPTTALSKIKSVDGHSLYDYQEQGVGWLLEMYRSGRSGGILADDMGLGKTVQISAFLEQVGQEADLSESGDGIAVLLVVPVAVVESWVSELGKWAPSLPVQVLHGRSARHREARVGHFGDQDYSRVMLTTYGIVRSSTGLLGSVDWDFLILDEGHTIKNPRSQISKAVRSLPAKCKLVLTGTPIQNNLEELWTIMDFVTGGDVLGDLPQFRTNYGTPIKSSLMANAPYLARRKGEALATTLKKIIQPYLLRREKAVALPDMHATPAKPAPASSLACSGVVVAATPGNRPDAMPAKRDVIVWVPLSETQREIYSQFLESKTVAQTLNQTQSPLAAISVLKKICCHPLLLRNSSLISVGLGLDQVNTDMAVDVSGKLVFLLELLAILKSESHRVAIFSQSAQMLNLLEKLMRESGYSYDRIDGSITSTEERQFRIDAFNAPGSETFVFLMTTQSCGVGITLTGADRVVLFDPQWNPAMDAQAVDRAYRIGQKKDVVVYRLIAAGTIEEKVYRKQVFKSTLTRSVTDDHEAAFRYFSRDDLRDVFSLGPPGVSETANQLNNLHDSRRDPPAAIATELARIKTEAADTMIGFSDHDLLFSDEAAAFFAQQEELAATTAEIDAEVGEMVYGGGADDGLGGLDGGDHSDGLERHLTFNDDEGESVDDGDDIFFDAQESLPSPSPPPSPSLGDRVCEEHRAPFRRRSQPNYTPCRCNLDSETLSVYSDLVELGNEYLAAGEDEEAQAVFIQALTLCDSDVDLRWQLERLSTRLALSSSTWTITPS